MARISGIQVSSWTPPFITGVAGPAIKGLYKVAELTAVRALFPEAKLPPIIRLVCIRHIFNLNYICIYDVSAPWLFRMSLLELRMILLVSCLKTLPFSLLVRLCRRMLLKLFLTKTIWWKKNILYRLSVKCFTNATLKTWIMAPFKVKTIYGI